MILSTPPYRRLNSPAPPPFPLHLVRKTRLTEVRCMLCIRTPPIPLLVPSHLAIKRLYTQNDHFLELTPCPAQAESRLHSSYCPGSPPQSLRSEGIAWKKPGRAFLGSSSESFTNPSLILIVWRLIVGLFLGAASGSECRVQVHLTMSGILQFRGRPDSLIPTSPTKS
jgi:hypothetical protein